MKNTPFGNIPDRWGTDTINNACSIVTDYVANGSFKTLADNVKYLNVEDSTILIRLADYNNNFDGNFVYVNDHAYEFLAKSKLYGDEIIISNVGSVGIVFKCPHLNKKMTLGPNAVMLKFKQDNDFYFYWLKSPAGQHMIKSITTGSVQPKFNKTNLRQVVIPVPPEKEQHNIASILKSLDKKIENNNQINKNLSEQAQALYKSWFVDFEPFGGVQPYNWTSGLLKDVLQLRKDGIKAGDNTELPYLPIDVIPMHNLSIKEVKPNEEAQSSLITFNKDDILIGAMRVYFHRVVIAPFDGITRATCFVLRPYDDAYLSFGLLCCNQDSSIDYAQATSKGSTMPYAVWDNGLGDMKVVIPDRETANEFNNVIGPMLKVIQESFFEVQKLQELRDSLLPKLMSGELDVSNLKFE